MKRKMDGLVFGVVLLMLSSNTSFAQPIPTNEWVNFFSTNSTIDTNPLPIGTVVTTFDPDSVLCGTFTVTTEGEYGFLAVYRDDTTTPDVDEGAEPGDTIAIFINDLPTTLLGPENPIWTFNGDVIQIDLQGVSNLPPVLSNIPGVSFYEDEQYILPINYLWDYVNDPNDADSSLIWNFVGSTHILTTFSSDTLMLESDPNWYGDDQYVTVIVQDNSGGLDVSNMFVSVIPVNDPPNEFALSSPFDSTFVTYWGGRTLDFFWSEAIDIDGDEISYRMELSTVDGWRTIDSTSTLQLAVNIDDFPRNEWIDWAVYASDSVSETKCSDDYSFIINQVVGNSKINNIPDKYSLSQNYPNPFNPSTTLMYGLPHVEKVSVTIYDIRGTKVKSLETDSKQAGWHQLVWNGKDDFGHLVNTGMYFCRMQAGLYSKTIKLVYLK